MNQEERTKFANNLLIDVQQVRSRCMEGFANAISENNKHRDAILSEMEPFLFGKGNILPAIIRSLEIGVSDIDIINFSYVINSSKSLRFYRTVGCETIEPNIRDILKKHDTE